MDFDFSRCTYDRDSQGYRNGPDNLPAAATAAYEESQAPLDPLLCEGTHHHKSSWWQAPSCEYNNTQHTQENFRKVQDFIAAQNRQAQASQVGESQGSQDPWQECNARSNSQWAQEAQAQADSHQQPQPPPQDAQQDSHQRQPPPPPPQETQGEAENRDGDICWNWGSRKPTSLGIIMMGNSGWKWTLRRVYLQVLYNFCTMHWWIMQGGSGPRAHKLWYNCFRVLELDNKAACDWWLMLSAGLPGRTCANKLLWEILTIYAVQDPVFWDISSWVSARVNLLRMCFDKPNQENLEYWNWSWLETTCYQNFSPTAVPTYFEFRKGQDGTPLEPPFCWLELTENQAWHRSQANDPSITTVVPGPQPTTWSEIHLYEAEQQRISEDNRNMRRLTGGPWAAA